MQIKETFNIYVHIVFLYLLPFFYSLIFIIFSRIIWENKLFVLLVYIYIYFLSFIRLKRQTLSRKYEGR